MRVGGHTNTYHTRSAEEAYNGIAAAGYTTVELTSVRRLDGARRPRRAGVRHLRPADATTG